MGLDIKDIKARLKNAYCDSLGYEEALADSCNDVASLIDELTELRANMSEMGRLLVEAKKEGARSAVKERDAVVAFLRETLATSETSHASDDLDYAIDIIERGLHRCEEKA